MATAILLAKIKVGLLARRIDRLTALKKEIEPANAVVLPGDVIKMNDLNKAANRLIGMWWTY